MGLGTILILYVRTSTVARPYTIAFNVTFLVGVIISLRMVEMILIMNLQAFIMGMPLNR